jgi:hypothetical protein
MFCSSCGEPLDLVELFADNQWADKRICDACLEDEMGLDDGE